MAVWGGRTSVTPKEAVAAVVRMWWLASQSSSALREGMSVLITVWQEVCSNCRLHDLPFWGNKPHWAAHTHAPSEQTHSQNSGYTPSVPQSCCGRRIAVWRVFERTIRVWRSGTTCKQPANLAEEGAEESLSILSDYTTTVCPPPKRC
jgi:hypothetical protein